MFAMNNEKVLIVEDEENERTGLAELVSSWGYSAETARDGQEGHEKILAWSPSIVITDLKMPRLSGLELLERISGEGETIAVIVVTAQGTIDSAVQAMRIGAYDYITKPIDTSRLRTILQNASALLGARVELEATRRKLRDAGSLGSLVGPSKKMQEIFRLTEMVAPSTASVLITGASGTGKELVARTIHELSPRRSRAFVAINCAAIPETLIESEIFGHEKGAFTGALERRTGCFELAEGGTLLLDEIGEMPIATQAKLLRVLEDRKLRRLGSKTETTVNVRELRNTLERAVIVCEGPVIETKHLPPGFGHSPIRVSVDDADSIRVGVGTTVGEAERLLILKTLESTNNNKTRAAEILGISLKTLHNKLKEYGSASADGIAKAEREETEELKEL